MAIKKVGVSAGHDLTTAGKRTPDGEREWIFNDRVIDGVIERLNQYQDVSVIRYDDPTGKTNIDRMARVRKANLDKVDLFFEAHANANTGSWGTWGGTETYTAQMNIPETERLAGLIHNAAVKTLGLRNRGLKKNNYDVLYFTDMPAVLLETAFMDSTTDIAILRNNALLHKLGYAIADAIATWLKVSLKPVIAPPPIVVKPTIPLEPIAQDLYYRVRLSWADKDSQKGAFMDYDRAVAQASVLSGYKVFDAKGVQLYPIDKPPVTIPEVDTKKVFTDETRKIKITIEDIE